MIFASFGNSPVPFLRMAEAIENYGRTSGEHIIVQNGLTKYEFKHCTAQSFMDKDTFLFYLKSCEIAILQGGWGGISEASALGVRIVVIPRIKDIEHHHDQAQLVKALEAEGVLLGCYDTKELPAVIQKAKTFNYKPIKRGDASKIINDYLNSLLKSKL